MSANTTTGNTFAMGTGNFTVEGWVYGQSSATMGIIDTRPTTSATDFYIAMTGGNQIIYYSGTTAMISSATTVPVANQWSHFALVRNAGISTLYINGTQSGPTAVDSQNYSTIGNIIVGGATGGTALYNGYISDLRVTKGVARYTANNQSLPSTPYMNK